MTQREETLPAAVKEAIRDLGANIATARVRREWKQTELAAKAGISRLTLLKLEAGAAGVSISAYAATLWALGLLDQLADVARPDSDAEGETLAAMRLGERVRLRSGFNDNF